MRLLIIFLLFFNSCYAGGQEPQYPQPLPVPPIEVTPASDGENLRNSVNLHRMTLGLKPLAPSDQLTCAASLQAAYLWVHGDCGHMGPGGQNFSQRVKMCGGRIAARGEVVACGHTDFVQVVYDWKDDPGHADIILNPKATHAGGARVGDRWVMVVDYGS